MFVKINKYIGLFLLCVLSILFAENTSASTRIEALHQTEKLFDEKQYNEAINIAEKAILQSNNCKDSIWAELKIRISLCHNRLWSNNSDNRGNEKALQHLKEAFNGYTPPRNNKLIYRICNLLCGIYMIPTNESVFSHPTKWHKDYGEVFKQSAELLISDKIRLDDASKYFVFSLREYYSDVVEKEKLDSIWNNEVHPFLKSHNLADKYYYNIKAEFYAEEWSYPRPIEAKIEQIAAYLSIPGPDRDTQKLAVLLNEMKYYLAASALFEQCIKGKYYNETADGEISLNRYIDDYYYIGCLQKLGEKNKIINICDKIIADPRFPKLGEYQQEYIKNIKMEAEGGKQDEFEQNTTSDDIDSCIDEIPIENLNAIDIESLDHKTRANLLIHYYYHNDFNSKTIKPLLCNNYGNDYALYRDIIQYLYNSKGEYELITHIYEFLQKNNGLDCLEEERLGWWHGAVFAPHSFNFYDIVGWSYYNIGDFENAIKCQQRTLDIVRTDYDDINHIVNSSERLRYFNFTTLSRYRYIETEIEQYINFGDLYLLIGQYENAYKMFKYAYDLNSELLQHSMTGSTDEKQKVWDRRRSTMLDIYVRILNYSSLFSDFSDLITELSASMKGFMLNYNLQTQNSIKAQLPNSKNLNSVVSNMQWAEKILEPLYNKYALNSHPSYKDYNSNRMTKNLINSIIDDCEANIDSYDLHIRNNIDSRAIIRNSFVKIDSIKNMLNSDDVLVDFMLYCYDTNSDSIEKKIDLRQEIVDTDTGKTHIETCLSKTYHNLKIYASIMRKDWEHPSVIFLGRLFDLIKEENNDIFDIVYFHNNKRELFSKLYKNPEITKSLWGKIISEADIHTGENIYFIANDIFNNIALESMAINSDTIMSDRYNMYRLSSVRELNKRDCLYSPSDKCVAFGYIEYGSTIFDNINDSNYPEILNRSKLQKLVATAKEIDLVKDLIPTTKRLWGYKANEYEFSKLSGKSPEILFFSTHGFNYDPYRLEQKESEYLYGDPSLRNIEDLSYETKSMYCSGLYLSMTPNTNKIDGLDNHFASNGMLTAKEVSLYDFSNTNLVILSACSSGLGGESKEGIYGLQRGFKLAGVDSIIATLWDVDEDASQMLITEFLKNYTSGISKHQSLKLAQSKVRNYKNDDPFNPICYANPFYWAGFILID